MFKFVQFVVVITNQLSNFVGKTVPKFIKMGILHHCSCSSSRQSSPKLLITVQKQSEFFLLMFVCFLVFGGQKIVLNFHPFQ